MTDILHDRLLLPGGQFTLGANYWASHAGVAMWRDWQPQCINQDFERLRDAGLQSLRVFPLWPDFQPIHHLRSGEGRSVEFRHGEAVLPSDDGVSEEALARFAVLADLARKHELSLIVGLITGWMSGRLFVPPALEGLNPISDPLSLVWQVRFVRRFVTDFKEHPAIAAWDLGNECNVMGTATKEQAWLWTASIANAVRAADSSRSIISGMHSLAPNPSEPWAIRDQGELTDILTTHPYPYWVPYAGQEAVNTLRPLLHATAQTRLYADLSGRPAFAEEIGTMGPMICDEDVAADFARASLISLWAHDCRAAFWWCAHDQDHLQIAPYDWVACERELGLLRGDGTPKPVLREIGGLRRALSEMPFAALPPRVTEAVCLLTPGQDAWGVGYSSFLLAKQAGFDLTYHFAGRTLPPVPLYLAPSLQGLSALSEQQMAALRTQVKAGATLYVSLHDAFISGFEELFGVRVHLRRKRHAPADICFDAIGPGFQYRSHSSLQLELRPTRAEVLGTEAILGSETDGYPILTRADYGRGTVYLLAFPLEMGMTAAPSAFERPGSREMWRLYQQIAGPHLSGRVISKQAPQIGITEHPLDDRNRVVIAINYAPDSVQDTLTCRDGWKLVDTVYGAAPEVYPETWACSLRGCDAAVWMVRKEA